MTQVRVSRHKLVAIVDIVSGVICTLDKCQAPVHQMILEYAFVKLMQDIRCKARENVTLW